jgi:SAM-dependent methyltransferase
MGDGLKRDAHYWDETARQWMADAGYSLWRRHSDAVNARLLADWLPDGRYGRCLKTDLFDEAFGDGLTPMLERQAELVVGIDVSPEVLNAARARCGARRTVHVAADVCRLPFEDGSFDSIVSLSTLDHFAAHDQVVAGARELCRTLRRGGQLVITMDNLLNPIVWARNGALYPWLHRLGVVPYFVGKTCGPRGLRRLVREAGLDVREVRAVMHCPRVLAVALARRLAGAPERTQRRFLRALMAFEHLRRLPLGRFLSGYFVAARAVKP